MKLIVNRIYEHSSGDKVFTERVLFYDSFEKVYVFIDIFSKNALPVIRAEKECIEMFESGILRELSEDPYSYLSIIPECEISDNKKIKRDNAWKILQPLIGKKTLEPFVKYKRGKIFSSIVKETGTSKKSIYQLFRRFYQRGQTKNALLSDYSKCGTNNSWRDSGKHQTLGRPSLNKPAAIKLNKQIKRNFKAGIKRFYGNKKDTLRRTYKLTIQNYFHEGYKLKNGVSIPIIPSADKLPTFRQFEYWYNKKYKNVKQKLQKQLGNTEFELDHRAILGDTSKMANGPHSNYETDATVGDIYLVSEFDRSKIIGRPVIYYIIDVFSRYVLGIAVTLEGPSWQGAMLALDNLFTDKKEFCAKYGIAIHSNEWFNASLPDKIKADRGEFEGYNVESMVNNLGIVVQNTPPYRGDFKGIVERAFGIANDSFIHFLPGAVIEKRKRGGQDYRLDAVLTLNEFRKILISHVKNYNNYHYLENYKLDMDMIGDVVDPIPRDLWEWGIENRSGAGRDVSRNVARLNFLPRKTVSVTMKGIHFYKDVFYSCDIAEQENWFETARAMGSRKIEIVYDPRDMSQIYIPNKNSSDLIVCNLTPASKLYIDRDFQDIKKKFAFSEKSKNRNITKTLQGEAEFNAVTEHIVDEAKRKTEVANYGKKESKAVRTANISENRAAEKATERQSRTFDPSNSSEKVEEMINTEDQETYIPEKSKMGILKKSRKK
jgi:hypothetical protein